MNSRSFASVVVLAIVGVLWGGANLSSAPLGTAFTYQGQLKQGGSPANGNFDLRLNLLDDPDPVSGNLIGTVTLLDVPVTDGLFNVEVDFGNVFNGDALWLELQVRPTGIGSLIPLSPTQPINATPYAQAALTGSGATGPTGATGPQGIPGPQGPTGPSAPSAICTWNGRTYSTGALCTAPIGGSCGSSVALFECESSGAWMQIGYTPRCGTISPC